MLQVTISTILDHFYSIHNIFFAVQNLVYYGPQNQLRFNKFYIKIVYRQCGATSKYRHDMYKFFLLNTTKFKVI